MHRGLLSLDQLATVDDEHLTGDVGERGGEGHERARHVVRGSQPATAVVAANRSQRPSSCAQIRSVRAVRMVPGATTFTRMPSSPSGPVSACISPITPAFAAE